MDDLSTPRTAHAAREDLQYIRQTLAAAGHISTVPGLGLVLVGILALGNVWLNHAFFADLFFKSMPPGGTIHDLAGDSMRSAGLLSWATLLLVATLTGVLAMREKAKRIRQPVWTPVLRKAMWGYGSALVLGALLTASLTFADFDFYMLPEVWLGCYGVALVSAGAHSVAPVRWMGLCFLLAAAGAAVTPASYGLTWLALGFGWVHIAFGAYIAWRYDG